MDGSRVDARTVALALLCLVVIAFAAATLDTTTEPESGVGFGGGSGDDTGFEGTPEEDDPGESDGTPFFVDLPGGGEIGFFEVCVAWLKQPLVRLGLVGGLVGLFLVGRWWDDEMLGLAAVFMVGYPGFIVYLVLTSCQTGPFNVFPDLVRAGSPTTSESGGLLGGQGSITSPSLLTQVLLVLVVLSLGIVAVAVLTGDHDQLTPEDADAEEEDEAADVTERRADVAAIGEAAGRAADRIEREGTFENEVYRAWSEMTEPLSVDRPASSTPEEFAKAAVAAGIDREDVDRLTALFEEVRYGGVEATEDREREAIATLRRIEETYGEDGEGS